MKKIYLLAIALISSFSADAQVVISQAYGGGGNSGATYTHDFIELFNRGTVAQNLTGWSVQYSGATGSGTWTKTDLPAVTLQPGQYYLIQQAQGAGGTTALPSPDLIPVTPITMSGTTFKVLLANDAVAKTGANPSDATIMDKVGFGSTVTGSEGTYAPILTNTTAGIRLNAGCTDNNNNSTDFVTGAPTPRNTGTALNVCSTDPSITITSPANGSTVHPWTNTINVGVSNFNLSTQGTVEYIVNGGAPVYSDATSFTITPTPGAAMTINVQLVDNANAPLSPAKTATATFTFANKTAVTDLAELRANYASLGYYELQSSPIATYTRTNRNQKYVQDASAGVLIDDASNVLSALTIVENDAVSGLKVQASEFNNVLQIIPITASGVTKLASSAVTPENITVAQYVATPENYESELIKFTNVLLTPTGGNFAANTDYTVTQGSDTTIFRTIFAEADYITPTPTAVPTAAQDIVALGGENATTKFVVVRRLANITLENEKFDNIAGLQVYPNPAKTNLFITSDSFAAKNVEFYNVLGAKVLSKQVNNAQVNVSGLKTGVYTVKITEEGKIATLKLVIE